MNILLKKAISVLFLTLFLVTSVFSADIVGFVDLPGYGLMSGRQRGLTVTARGRQVISYRIASQIGGVIFQAVATPVSSVKDMPVSLAYKAEQPDGQRFIVTIGDNTIVTNLYDWQLIPTARFAATPFTACMTLLGRSASASEIQLHNKNTGRIMWAEFHPDFINTLTGINLFFIDALLIDGNLNPLRQVTSALNGVIPGYNDINTDETISALSSLYIQILLIGSSDKWDSYIYTDYGTDISYELKDGKLTFTGVPAYLFLGIDDETETVTVNEDLSNLIRQEINEVRDINPVIYRAAEQAAQLAAFFRMVKEQNPKNWSDFISSIHGITPDTQIETPRYWLRD